MNDNICIKKAMPLLKKFGYTTINENVLDAIMNKISTHVLHYQYKD